MSFSVHAMYFLNSCSIIFWIPDNTLLKRLWLLSCPHSTCTFTIVRKHKLVRKLKTLPGREILLYGIGFGKEKKQSERERMLLTRWWLSVQITTCTWLKLSLSSWSAPFFSFHFLPFRLTFAFDPSGWHLQMQRFWTDGLEGIFWLRGIIKGPPL